MPSSSNASFVVVVPDSSESGCDAFDGVGVRFALEVLGFGEDFAVALPVVGGVSELSADSKRLAQRSGCSGVAITQRPAEYLVGSAINKPPEPNRLFF